MSQYVSAYPDPKVSGRVSMTAFRPHSVSSPASLPADLLFSLLLSKSLLSLSLYIASEWLLAQGVSVWILNAWTLGIGAVGLGVWEHVWEKPRQGRKREDALSPIYAFLFLAETLTSLLALKYLSVLKFILLSSSSAMWTRGLPLPFLRGLGSKRTAGKNNALFITTAMVVVAYLVDSTVSVDTLKTGYILLLLHLYCSGTRLEILAVHSLDEDVRRRAHAFGVGGAAVLGAVIGWMSWIIAPESIGELSKPAAMFSNTFRPPEATFGLLLPSAVFLGATLIIIDPLLSKALLAHFSNTRVARAGWRIATGSTVFVGYVGFGKGAELADALVGIIAWTAVSHLVSSDPRSSTPTSSAATTGNGNANTPFLARLSDFYRHLRATIKTILETPDSRRIYFFLCLNLAYMFIQMAYGIWTNSLGLISDSIHMFFDCLALGMGLFASVMATWEPNDKFTYGYSRVETLSGFANGLFLCLISIFIVFEAIQRLIDPPEMNTSQLLVVSSLGLAVNLVGMMATGHNHHGHSHGGGGSSHATHTAQPTVASSHNGHSHEHAGHASHGNGHDHSQHSGHNGHHHQHDGADGDDDDSDDDSGHGHASSGNSHNMKGVFLHVMADTLGSVGVIISTLLINRYGWTGFDPLASIFIAVLIFASVVPLVMDSARLLVLDMGEERETEVKNALASLKHLEGVSSYSAARFWSKDPSAMIGSISVQLAPSPSSHDPGGRVDTSSSSSSSSHPQHYANIEKVRTRVTKALRNAIAGLEELTIQIEPTHGLN